jgi:signal transduction histidine kinase
MSRYTEWLESIPGATDPDDFRLDTIKLSLPFIYIISAILLFIVPQFESGADAFAEAAGVMLALGALGAQWLGDHNLRIAWTIFVLAILLSISILALGFPDSPASYFFPVAIFMASLLTYTANIIFVTLGSLFAVQVIALQLGYSWLDLDYVVGPALLILFTGLATFIITRHQHDEFRRARHSSAQVREMLEQLRQQRVELDRTIQTLGLANERIESMNAELIVARKAAEDADAIKTEFLAHMSHELRTPMNAILNFSAFVADGLMGDVNKEQVKTLQKVMDSGNHLLSLINDILDISKIEAGMMNLFVEEVDLNLLLMGTISTAKGLTKNSPIELISEIDKNLPKILGDKRRIRQIFLNLISNAVKFTPEGIVSLGASQEDKEIHIYIKDTGIGIAPEDQDTVFEAFRQAEHDLQNVVGTGLGMPICKHFIEAHGGTISFESELGKGTTFYIALPLENEDIKNLAMAV